MTIDIDEFEIWFEQEGKNLIPSKQAMQVSWSNGAYKAWERFDTVVAELEAELKTKDEEIKKLMKDKK